MKQNKAIVLLIILSIFIQINLFAQDFEPNQRTFTIGGISGKYLDKTNSYFDINNFTLGWQWGDEYKISKVFKMNQKDLSSNNADNINPNTNLFIRSGYQEYSFYSHCDFSKSHIYGKSLKYDPTLYIDPNNVYKLNKREGDPSNPIFGFRS